MKKILFVGLILPMALVAAAHAVDFEDDILRYGGTLSSVNLAADEITVRDTARGAERTIRVEPRVARSLREGATIDLPAVISADTGSQTEGARPPLASGLSEAAAMNE